MRRLNRAMLNIFTAMSLLLCFTTLVLWGRSRGAIEWWPIFTSEINEGGGGVMMDRSTSYLIVSESGRVLVRRTFLPVGDRYRRATGIEAKLIRSQLNRADDIDELRVITSLARFEVATGRRSFGSERRVLQRLAIPYWSLTLATGLASGICVRGILRRGRRRRSGLCASCGYDLRATPDRCPECGAVPTAQAAKPGEAEG